MNHRKRQTFASPAAKQATQLGAETAVRKGPKVTRDPLALVRRFENAAELGPQLVRQLRGSDRGA